MDSGDTGSIGSERGPTGTLIWYLGRVGAGAGRGARASSSAGVPGSSSHLCALFRFRATIRRMAQPMVCRYETLPQTRVRTSRTVVYRLALRIHLHQGER